MDGNEITAEAIHRINSICSPEDERGDYAVYQVWRSAGMAEVSQRLAMVPPHVPAFDEGGLAKQ
ncbi:hypothetical protein N7453_001217 [Penicillium expansum]|nr:hypothetical protein N7453_001217 [Penicillium expansum]